MGVKNGFGKFINNIKLVLYKNMFSKSEKKGEDLSLSEYFCLQCINLLEKPTISQFAAFLNVSAPNATYKLKQLIKKGYVTKERSESDKREYVLVPTEKFYKFLNSQKEDALVNEVKMGLNERECKKIDQIISILNEQ